MAIFRSLKTLISQSIRKQSNSASFRALTSLSITSPSPIPIHFFLPSNSYIRRHFLFRSRFLSPARGPLLLFNPPWKLSQSATPLLLQSDAVLNILKLRALNLLHQPAFPYNLRYNVPRLLSESKKEEYRNRAEVDASVGDNGISDSYLNIPNCISITRLLSGPLLGWMIIHDMYSSAFIGLAISGASDWLDGYMARKMGINSVVGSYLDPLADKVLIGCVALAMVDKDLLHPGLVALVVLRDIALVGGAVYIRANSFDWKVNSWRDFFNLDGAQVQKVEPLLISKVNTVFQLGLVAAAILQPAFGNEETQMYINYLSCLVASTTVASTAAYGVQHWRNGAVLMNKSKFQSILRQHRLLCTSATSNSHTLLESKEKSREALSLIRFEQNPNRILDICRSAALSHDSHLDRIVFSRAIRKLRESNHHEGIRAFIKESMNQLNCKSERALSHLIILYGHGGLITDALNLFDEMRTMGIDRNTKTLNSLLFSCLLAGEYTAMKRIFLEFPRKYELEPNLETYNTVLKGLCTSGSANEAHSVLAEMMRKGIEPTKMTFATVIAGFYREEKFSDVGKMLHLMKEYSIQPGISIYNVRIQSLCKLGRCSEAKALLDGMLCRGMKPNWETYSHLIYGFCRQGKLDTAKSLFKEMVDTGMSAEAECYFTLVYYLCQGRDFEAALSICVECMSKGWMPNTTTMRSLVNGLVSISKFDEAREIIGEVRKRFSRNAHIWNEIEDRLPK